jgi:hypothetical protein
MSNPHLPEEMLDGIVDHLRGIKSALINCSLVSKSWIPRARRHLFVDIRFYTTKRLRSWKETFPDLSSSPACYAKTLAIDCLQVVTAADAEEGGWITGFSHVVHLEVACRAVRPDPEQPKISLVPFHGFSPAIKSLRVTVPALSSLRVFDLIFSFPLLEDLSVVIPYEPLTGDGDGSRGDEIPARLPALESTRIYWVPRALSAGRDETFHPPITVPPWRYPLPEAHLDVVS